MARIQGRDHHATVHSLVDATAGSAVAVIEFLTVAASERDRARDAERHYVRRSHGVPTQQDTRSAAAAATFDRFYKH